MKLTEAELLEFIDADESERLEFKRALPDPKIVGEYAVALGNEGGGWILIGITDRRPRKIIGISPQSPSDLRRLQRSVFDFTDIRVETCSVTTASGYVLGLNIPPRPPGQILHTKSGKYLMRMGEDLRGMTPAEINKILNEAPRSEGDSSLEKLALFEVRKLRYEIEQAISFKTEWEQLGKTVSKLKPYGRDFDFAVQSEVIYTANIASDPARYGMPAEVAHRICHVVSESLPITNLVSRSHRHVSKQDEQLLSSALGVVHSLAWDSCRYVRDVEITQSVSNLLTIVLRYAVLNDIKSVEEEALDIVERCVKICGEKDELVKILLFAKNDALTYREKRSSRLPSS
jgi:hypothetical protein